MNKIIFLIGLFIIFCCKTYENKILAEQIKTNHPIVLKYNKAHNKFSRIKIPLKIKIENNSVSDYNFASIRYEYNSGFKGIKEDLYTEENQKLKKIINNEKKTIKSKKNKEFIMYTSHRLDSSKQFQEKLTSYLKKVKENNKKISIGSISEFKLKNHALLTFLTKNDSVIINTWKGENIILSIKW